VALQEGQLVLRRQKYGASQLQPTFVDGFTGDLVPGTGDVGGLISRLIEMMRIAF